MRTLVILWTLALAGLYLFGLTYLQPFIGR
jgi:hypothetical protein